MAIIWWSLLVLLMGAAGLFAVLLARVTEARRASRTPNCHYCGNPALRLSSPDHWVDPLLAHWHCVPYRCDVCYRRQYRYAAMN